MSCFVSHTSVDCRNAYDLSEWWKSLLGYVDIEGDPNLPGHEECMIRDGAARFAAYATGQVACVWIPTFRALVLEDQRRRLETVG